MSEPSPEIKCDCGLPDDCPHCHDRLPERTPYDSTADTHDHIKKVFDLLSQVVDELILRARHHDQSKLHPPEKEVFDVETPKLRRKTYGSREYRVALESMEAALDHHYRLNRHHPEHFENGIDGMTLIDLLEMLCDWMAATKRHEDGDIWKSLEINAQRFDIGEQLLAILGNTVSALTKGVEHEPA